MGVLIDIIAWSGTGATLPQVIILEKGSHFGRSGCW